MVVRSCWIIISNIGLPKSFADDLNTELGIVNGRVALLLRSIEIKPWFLRFVLYEHFSSSLSLARSLWVTEVDEPHNRPYYAGARKCSTGKYAGSRKCSAENMLGHGSAVRKICWVTEVQYEKYAGPRKTTATRLARRSCRAKSRRPFGVLCSSVPQSDFHSHPPF